jgi:hypothetical protein
MQNANDLDQIERTFKEACEFAERIVDTVREPLLVLDAIVIKINMRWIFQLIFFNTCNG